MAQYDPAKWNAYPDVLPPTGVLMRAETPDGRERFCAKGARFYGAFCWVDCQGRKLPQKIRERIVRFRPWDD